LIIEWSKEEVVITRDKEVILRRYWSSTDGNCSQKISFWKIKNLGPSVILGEIVSGTQFYISSRLVNRDANFFVYPLYQA
jgi:hypothetical protein